MEFLPCLDIGMLARTLTGVSTVSTTRADRITRFAPWTTREPYAALASLSHQENLTMGRITYALFKSFLCNNDSPRNEWPRPAARPIVVLGPPAFFPRVTRVNEMGRCGGLSMTYILCLYRFCQNRIE